MTQLIAGQGMGFREDQGLLFGLLALQNNFVSQADLMSAFGVWVADKSVELERLISQRGQLTESDHQLLKRLCERHLATCGGDATATLAKLAVDTPIRAELQRFADTDPDLEKSLTHLRTVDPLATQTIGDSSATGGGRFSFLRPLDRGGLGVVSVALDRELNREVAIKQIREDRADEDAYRNKFVLEAEVTGGLEHPGIVPVYGLGKGPDGRPYYAMRLIRGDNLRTHIQELHHAVKEGKETFDGTRLRQLLRRFLDVCDAVAYAHSRGVLHRDLKPANVMVGKFGETLLVDWGLAKAVGRDSSIVPTSSDADLMTAERLLTPSGSDANLTVHGQAIGTAAYAAPEQISGSLDRVSERSDVYGLGAILYEILSGVPPIDGSTIEEMIRKAIKNQIRSPREIVPKVPRAIAAVAMKALSGSPEDRYASAMDLKADVEAWLDDEPVSALPDTASSQTARWLRKNRGFAASTAVGLLVLSIVSLVFAGTFNSQKVTAERLTRDAQRAQREADEKRKEAEDAEIVAVNAKNEAAEALRATERARQLAESNRIEADEARIRAVDAQMDSERARAAAEQAAAERDVALEKVKGALEKSQREAQTSARLSQFVTGIFQASDPIGVDSLPFLLAKRSTADMTLASALQMGAERMHEELGDEPLVLAEVTQSIGSAFRSLGRYEEAIALMRESLDLRREYGADDKEKLAVVLQNLALVELETGDFVVAEKHIREALEICQKLEGGQLAVADCQFYLAWIKGQSYRVVEGEKLFRECLNTRLRLLGINHRKTRFAQLGVSFCLLEQGRVAEASVFGIAAGTALRASESENPAVHIVSDFLGGVIKGKIFGAADGEAQLKTVLKMVEEELGTDTIYSGLVRFEMARLVDQQGRHEEAADLLALCWEDGVRFSQLRHPKILIMARVYSDLLNRIGQYDQGLDILKQFRDAQTRTYESESELACLAEFALLTYQEKQLEPEQYWGAVKQLSNKLFAIPDLSRESLQYIETLGIYYSDLNTDEGNRRAEEVYSQMWQQLERSVDKSDSDWGILAASRISLMMQMGQPEAAMECFEAVESFADEWKDTGSRGAQEGFYLQSSRLFMRLNRFADALKYFKLRRELWVTDANELYYLARDAARCYKACEDQQVKEQMQIFALQTLERALSNGFSDYKQLERASEIWDAWPENPTVQKLLSLKTTAEPK